MDFCQTLLIKDVGEVRSWGAVCCGFFWFVVAWLGFLVLFGVLSGFVYLVGLFVFYP